MKKLLSLLILLCCTLSSFAWKPIFAGHRGSYKGVQNTVEAYRNGVDVYGFAGLECDVRVTADKQYVIMHDETTNSLGGKLTVADATLADLQAETLTQTRGGVSYTGKICTVAEYLDICKEKKAFPVIELKWSTGINNNDMSNFPGLLELVKEKGLENSAVFLTSMKSSIEYIRKNYPEVKCQFLTGQAWASHFDWCVEYNVEPSIQAGYFDIQTVKKFHDVNLKVAMWTVNDEANYQKYSQMGVYMMTSDYLTPGDLPEMEEVDFDNIPEVIAPLQVVTEVLWRRSINDSNLPEEFPAGAGVFKTAQQAAYYEGTFYINDYGTSTLLTFNKDGRIANTLKGGSSHGIAVDDAGNLAIRNDGITPNPNKLLLYKKGENTPSELTFSLLKDGQANFIFASGDLFSAEGGYIYLYPNAQKFVNVLHIAKGALVEVTVSGELSTAGSTAGIVIPTGNDPDNFIYQVRNVGYYRYKDGKNAGDYLTGGANTKAPARNSSLGGAYFVLDGHEILVHQSGTNYNGGLTLRDMSADGEVLASFSELGNAAYAGNPSTGSFVKAEKIDDNTVHLYQYCMGNGIAAYKVSLLDVPDALATSKENAALQVYPSVTEGAAYIRCEEPIRSAVLYSATGSQIGRFAGNGANEMKIDLAGYPSGLYIIRVNGVKAERIIRK